MRWNLWTTWYLIAQKWYAAGRKSGASERLQTLRQNFGSWQGWESMSSTRAVTAGLLREVLSRGCTEGWNEGIGRRVLCFCLARDPRASVLPSCATTCSTSCRWDGMRSEILASRLQAEQFSLFPSQLYRVQGHRSATGYCRINDIRSMASFWQTKCIVGSCTRKFPLGGCDD
jgi:hypothetical protein